MSRWAKRLEPCRTRNKPATKIHPDQLIRDVEQLPDACQHERAERSQRGICEALKRLKISVYALMRLPLIYIDESGFSEEMSSMFGHAPTCLRLMLLAH